MNKTLKSLTVIGLIATSLMSFTAAITSQNYTAVNDKTKIKWIGRKVGGEHEGVVKLKSGDLTMDGEDFFNVKAFPESKLVITGSKALEDGKLEVSGKMTILDKTEDIKFVVANTGKTENFRIFSANISIDRTKFGITYKSSLLGDATIKDNFDIKVKLVVKKS